MFKIFFGICETIAVFNVFWTPVLVCFVDYDWEEEERKNEPPFFFLTPSQFAGLFHFIDFLLAQRIDLVSVIKCAAMVHCTANTIVSITLNHVHCAGLATSLGM
jgi:hypothetical protein